MRHASWRLTLCLMLGACGAEVVLPPAQPLAASAGQLAQIPRLTSGPHQVLKGAPEVWAAEGRSLRLRVVQPEGTGPFPLVIFSHGFASDIDQYDALLEHWASHGYLIVLPYHLDGGGSMRGIANSILEGKQGLIEARLADVQFILRQLGKLPQADPSRIALAGHSFGAFTAQQLAGAVAADPEQGLRISGRDPRVRAVVAVSPPGRMFGLINEQSWRTMERPMLVTTGTWDVDGRFVHEWREHALSFETAPAGRNWLMVTAGADHYLGNLICRTQRKAPPQTDALRMVNALAVTFLDAFVRDDAGARAFLEQNPLQDLTGGFTRLEHR